MRHVIAHFLGNDFARKAPIEEVEFLCETQETLQATLDYSRELPLHSAWFSYMVPFPGTPVWDEGIERHGTILDWNMAEWGNVKPIFLARDLKLEQLTGAMAESNRIREEIRRRPENRLAGLRMQREQWWTRMKCRKYTFLQRLRQKAA